MSWEFSAFSAGDSLCSVPKPHLVQESDGLQFTTQLYGWKRAAFVSRSALTFFAAPLQLTLHSTLSEIKDKGKLYLHFNL